MTVNGIRMVCWERIYQVFRTNGLCVGAWNNEAAARCEFQKRGRNRLVVSDEYRALRLPDLGHVARLFVSEEVKVSA